MPFDLPEKEFDPVEHAINSTIRCNQSQTEIIRQITEPYDHVWGVSGGMQDVTDDEGNTISKWVGGGTRYTPEQMSAKMNAIGVANLSQMSDQHAALVLAIESLDPGVIPVPYHEAAWNYKLDEDGVLTAIALKEVWVAPGVPEEQK